MPELSDRILQYDRAVGSHAAGALTSEPLHRIESYLQTYFNERPVRSVETGCGASTILFAAYASQHTVYCVDDQPAQRSSVGYVQEFPGFHHDRVHWIFGPTQRTVFEQPQKGPIDVILLDGPHGFPFPELEYCAFYKCLVPGGLLILDDIHIPTINNFYQFLLEDDGFRPVGTTANTAFFQRTDTPAFNMEGDGWWLQRYNVQKFPVTRTDYPSAGLALPISILFDRSISVGAPILTRGFSLRGTPPLSDGYVSNIDLKLAQDSGGPLQVEVEVDLEPVCVPERQGAGVRVVVGGDEVRTWMFDSSARQTIAFRAAVNEEHLLSIQFRHLGLKIANKLEAWPKPWGVDFRLPNFRLHAITVRDSLDGRAPTTLRRADGSIVAFDYDNKQFSFFVDQPDGPSESYHALGRFHKLDALEQVRSVLPAAARILDIGAHVGNDCVYFDRIMEAQHIVAIESDPRAQFLLRTNCALNCTRNVDLSYLGVALSKPTAHRAPHGDDLFSNEKFDLIKVDLAEVGIDVLEGFARRIPNSQPWILATVRDSDRTAFVELLTRLQYSLTWQASAHSGSTHYLARRADISAMVGQRIASALRSAIRKGRHLANVA